MLSDFLGRRPVLGIADIIFIGGAIGQAVCHTVWSMVRPRVHTCASTHFTEGESRLAAVSSLGSASVWPPASLRSTSKNFPPRVSGDAWWP